MTLVSLSFSYYEAWGEKRGLRPGLGAARRGIGRKPREMWNVTWRQDSSTGCQRIAEHLENREHLSGLAIYGGQANLLRSDPAAGIHAGYSSLRNVSSLA